MINYAFRGITMNAGIIGGVDGPTSVTITVKLNPIVIIIIIAIVLMMSIIGFIVWRRTRGKK